MKPYSKKEENEVSMFKESYREDVTRLRNQLIHKIQCSGTSKEEDLVILELVQRLWAVAVEKEYK